MRQADQCFFHHTIVAKVRNDSLRVQSDHQHPDIPGGLLMNSKTLIACLALVGGMAAIAPGVQAADPAHKTVQPGVNNSRTLVVGDRAPEVYQRSEKAVNNWKQKGLKAPKAQAQWVQINDKYMMVMITNGTIMDIAPVER
ncbi:MULTISPECIES: RcnB family protein [unclassified Pseudomonas]|uniref:RcnB family protein n=1 Tax=unclassified Pseudomonas TaxID=196821 RepID=UPI002AC97A49|nr:MULTISPECIES: RcnB family protein [unclassified Pseudomonas]MEB0045679.1 RcnB family protein [Pseudomonas sp. Dout3]MEB0095562.1 RcnB family protein [Pseudomonas sp. DC1.2]WPX61143.1 RcnB family protein [Pseudomonas sp. DC1.2]